MNSFFLLDYNPASLSAIFLSPVLLSSSSLYIIIQFEKKRVSACVCIWRRLWTHCKAATQIDNLYWYFLFWAHWRTFKMKFCCLWTLKNTGLNNSKRGISYTIAKYLFEQYWIITMALPLKTFWKQQTVQNALAKAVMNAYYFTQWSSQLCKLYCLPFGFQVQFK